MKFEHPFGGAMTATGTVAISETPPAPEIAYPPVTIIQRDHPWQLQVDWSINGLPAQLLGGKWHVSAFIESIGGGFEGQVGATVDVDLSTAPALLNRAYSATINVPAANTIPGFNAGAYRLTVLVNYSNLGVPGEIAGVEELPVMQFYNAPVP